MVNRIMQLIRKIARLFGVMMIALVALAAVGYLWAYLSTGYSLAARGIMWGGSKYDDWKRFPSRVVHAGDAPAYFGVEENDIFEDFTIEDTQLEDFLEATNTTAFIVLHDDALLYEGYFNGSSHEATQASFSAAKSFVSTLVGIAIEEGYIDSLDDPVTTYIPELLERDTRFGDITLRHLLMMSSGLRFERDPENPFSDDFITSHSTNMRRAALNTEIVEEPGQSFHYNDYNPQLIGMVLERATGMSVSEYLATRLWTPMGAEADGSWDLDSRRSGFERMSVGINGRAIDFAKLGWLFLHDGKVGDRQVVPQAWVEQVTHATDAMYTARAEHAYFYQNYWWLDVENDAYFAEGNFGQWIYVYPAADLVLVRNGMNTGGIYWTGLLAEIAQAIEAELNRQVRNEELRGN
ncbi:MAG: serine hydrolase [Anaerolineales bacterium]|nr:serine hydrolase [Anaerolineales bacterium]